MKRYMICLFLFIGVSAACLVAGYCINQENQNTSISSTEDKERETMATIQPTETVPENLAAVNRDQVLLVFGKDKETICLYTHIPLMDFPTREQERLREGIWFPDMMDVIHYLESYTS